ARESLVAPAWTCDIAVPFSATLGMKPPRGGPAAPESLIRIAHVHDGPAFLPPAARSTSPNGSTTSAAAPSGSRRRQRAMRADVTQVSLQWPSIELPWSFTSAANVEILCTFAIAVGIAAAKPLQPRSGLSSGGTSYLGMSNIFPLLYLKLNVESRSRAAFYFFPLRGRCTIRRRRRLVSSSGAEHVSAAGLFSPAAGKVCVAVPFFFRLRRGCHSLKLAVAPRPVRAPRAVSTPAPSRFSFRLRRAILLYARFSFLSPAACTRKFFTPPLLQSSHPLQHAARRRFQLSFACGAHTQLGKRVKNGAFSLPAAHTNSEYALLSRLCEQPG
ncbi:hypothetical protein AURDEDRAFT_178793, partial [Auricularia subglabra TFB-10046 SS5]